MRLNLKISLNKLLISELSIVNFRNWLLIRKVKLTVHFPSPDRNGYPGARAGEMPEYKDLVLEKAGRMGARSMSG